MTDKPMRDSARLVQAIRQELQSAIFSNCDAVLYGNTQSVELTREWERSLKRIEAALPKGWVDEYERTLREEQAAKRLAHRLLATPEAARMSDKPMSEALCGCVRCVQERDTGWGLQ